jgi:hypothetical protein
MTGFYKIIFLLLISHGVLAQTFRVNDHSYEYVQAYEYKDTVLIYNVWMNLPDSSIGIEGDVMAAFRGMFNMILQPSDTTKIFSVDDIARYFNAVKGQLTPAQVTDFGIVSQLILAEAAKER